MDKKKIIKLAGVGILATSLGVGLMIHDTHVDHTKEICPITWLLNAIPFDLRVPTGVKIHQIPMMEKEYLEKGVGNAEIEFGTFLQETRDIEFCNPIINEYGIPKAPEGFVLLYDVNGNPYCKKDITTFSYYDNSIRTTWGAIIHNVDDNTEEYEHVDYIRLLK